MLLQNVEFMITTSGSWAKSKTLTSSWECSCNIILWGKNEFWITSLILSTGSWTVTLGAPLSDTIPTVNPVCPKCAGYFTAVYKNLICRAVTSATTPAISKNWCCTTIAWDELCVWNMHECCIPIKMLIYRSNPKCEPCSNWIPR